MLDLQTVLALLDSSTRLHYLAQISESEASCHARVTQAELSYRTARRQAKTELDYEITMAEKVRRDALSTIHLNALGAYERSLDGKRQSETSSLTRTLLTSSDAESALPDDDSPWR